MNPRTLMQRHRTLRWLAPAGVVGVAALVATGMFKDTASPEGLPTTSAGALLAGVKTATTTGMSGTVVTNLDLGLPELPMIAVGGTGSSLPALMSGSHTLRVWFGNEDQQRIALLGATDETDLFRNGRTLWEWSSSNRTAVHLTLPADSGTAGLPDPGAVSPPAVASTALQNLDPSTKVAVRGGGSVADRATYDLILTPRSSTTRVGSVHIAVDGATKVPLAVQIYARGSDSPALDVAFTSVSYSTPPARNFTFSPPSGATVHRLHLAGTGSGTSHGLSSASRLPAVPRARVIGNGWTQVVTTTLPAKVRRTVQTSGLYQRLIPVAGTWGSGRLLSSDLVNVLVTDDGHVFAGAVEPSALFALAARS